MSSRFWVQISSLHWSHCRVWIFSLCAFPPTYPRSGLVVFKLAVGVAVSCGLSVLVLWWTVQLYRVYPTSHSWQLGCSPAPPRTKSWILYLRSMISLFFFPSMSFLSSVHTRSNIPVFLLLPFICTIIWHICHVCSYGTVLVYRIWITHNFWVRNIVQYSQPHTFFFRHSQSNTIVQMV